MADQKEPASVPAPVGAEMKVEEAKPEIKTAEPGPAKKLWSDEDFGEADFSGLRLAEAVDDIVDTPERMKSEAIVEPETIKKVVADATPYTSAMSFEDLNLSPQLLLDLYSEMKFEKPSKIQAATLPMIVTPPYKNLTAQAARNGSGKATCFSLGMLNRVDPQLKAPQALCVSYARARYPVEDATCEED